MTGSLGGRGGRAEQPGGVGGEAHQGGHDARHRLLLLHGRQATLPHRAGPAPPSASSMPQHPLHVPFPRLMLTPRGVITPSTAFIVMRSRGKASHARAVLDDA